MWQIHIISYVSPVLYFSCHILHNLVNCTGIFVLITQWDPKCSLLVKILGSLCSCLLPEVVEVTTVKQLPEYHECSGAYILFSHPIFILMHTGIYILVTHVNILHSLSWCCLQKMKLQNVFRLPRRVDLNQHRDWMMIKKSAFCHLWLVKQITFLLLKRLY